MENLEIKKELESLKERIPNMDEISENELFDIPSKMGNYFKNGLITREEFELILSLIEKREKILKRKISELKNAINIEDAKDKFDEILKIEEIK